MFKALLLFCSKLSGRKLELLNLSGNSLHHVASSLVAEAAASSRQFDFSLTNLRPEQSSGRWKEKKADEKNTFLKI